MKLEQLFENEDNLITPTKFKNYYLEVCPEKYRFLFDWGPINVLYGCTSEIDGYKNTVQMYLHGNELAKRVLNLNIDGKDDWYIPAKDELNHICESKIITDRALCWSSTEFNDGRCWAQHSTEEITYRNSKNGNCRIIPVRRVYGI